MTLKYRSKSLLTHYFHFLIPLSPKLVNTLQRLVGGLQILRPLTSLLNGFVGNWTILTSDGLVIYLCVTGCICPSTRSPTYSRKHIMGSPLTVIGGKLSPGADKKVTIYVFPLVYTCPCICFSLLGCVVWTVAVEKIHLYC